MMYSNFKVDFFLNFDFYMYYSYKTQYTVLVAFLKCPYLNFGYLYDPCILGPTLSVIFKRFSWLGASRAARAKRLST